VGGGGGRERGWRGGYLLLDRRIWTNTAKRRATVKGLPVGAIEMLYRFGCAFIPLPRGFLPLCPCPHVDDVDAYGGRGVFGSTSVMVR
jgi:hypothetical protein